MCFEGLFVIIKTLGDLDYVSSTGLAFHPTDCADYKVVCIFRDGKVCKIQIYSSNLGKWKISNQSFNSPSDIRFSEQYFDKLFTCGVYWNGAIYWAPTCPDPLYLKLEIEQLQKLPLPLTIASSGGYQVGKTPLYFGESRGHLRLVEIADLVLNVYEMSSDHSEWFLKYQVELDELLAAYPETKIYKYRTRWICSNCRLEVLDIVRGELEGDTFMVLQVSYPMLAIGYNFLKKSFKQLSCIPDFRYYNIEESEAYRYIESIGTLPIYIIKVRNDAVLMMGFPPKISGCFFGPVLVQSGQAHFLYLYDDT